MSERPSSVYTSTPRDAVLGYMFLLLIFFIWPFTGAWKATLNHEDVRDIRGYVAATSAAGIALYFAALALAYNGLYWWIVLAFAGYLIVSSARLLAQASFEG